MKIRIAVAVNPEGKVDGGTNLPQSHPDDTLRAESITAQEMKYLGNLSESEPSYSIGLTCHHCNVCWTGCAAAANCPQCGTPKGYWPDDFDKCFCEKCLDAKETP